MTINKRKTIEQKRRSHSHRKHNTERTTQVWRDFGQLKCSQMQRNAACKPLFFCTNTIGAI